MHTLNLLKNLFRLNWANTLKITLWEKFQRIPKSFIFEKDTCTFLITVVLESRMTVYVCDKQEKLTHCNSIKSMGRVKRVWYLSPMRAAKVQASLRIRAVSPEPPLLDHTSSESRGTFRQKARSLAPLNGWACAVKICHDGMFEDTKSLDAAPIILYCCLIFLLFWVLVFCLW